MALLVSGPSLSSHVVLPYSVQAVPGEGDWGGRLGRESFFLPGAVSQESCLLQRRSLSIV